MTVTFTNPVPFLVGFVPAVLYVAKVVAYDISWRGRHNVRKGDGLAIPSQTSTDVCEVSNPFEYDSDYRQALAYFREQFWNFEWVNILLAPFVVGLITHLVWWTIYLLVVIV